MLRVSKLTDYGAGWPDGQLVLHWVQFEGVTSRDA